MTFWYLSTIFDNVELVFKYKHFLCWFIMRRVREYPPGMRNVFHKGPNYIITGGFICQLCFTFDLFCLGFWGCE